MVELTADAIGRDAWVHGVTFTHGDRFADGPEPKVGKAWLVSRLQVSLQQGRLHLPRTPDAERLAQELLDCEMRIDQDANDR